MTEKDGSDDVELTKRLLAITQLVEAGSVIADVGTDHGYIPIYLAERGLIKKGYAMDVNRGPLEKARVNIEESKVEGLVVPVLSDGLEKLMDDAVDTVIVAGMGGMLTCRILEEGKDKVSKVRKMILSPHLDVDQVRRKVHELRFSISEEVFLEDGGQFYTVLVCENKQEAPWEDVEYRYGKCLIEKKDPLLKAYVIEQRKKQEDVIEHLKRQGTENARERLLVLEKEVQGMDEVIGWL